MATRVREPLADNRPPARERPWRLLACVLALSVLVWPALVMAQKGGGGGKAAGGGAKGPFTGYSGGDNIIGGANPALYGNQRYYRLPKHRGPTPRHHHVKRGDTLWDLCDYYYGDPWAWPQLWAYNKSITNPHWIYPGNRLRLFSSRRVRGGRPLGISVVRGRHLRYTRGPVQLHQVGYIDPKTMEASGRIIGSKLEKLMFSPYDQVYARGQGNFKLHVGQRVTFFRVRRKLASKKRGKLGHIVEILGRGVVKRINKHKVATIQLTNSRVAIHRGDRVGALRRTYKRLPVRPSKVTLKAHIVDLMRNQKRMIGTDELVFIDAGRKQGVELGNRFLVLRRGDGYRQNIVLPYKRNPKFPREIIAEISVLDLRDNASVGLVTRARREMRVGDRVRLRRGY